MKVTIFTPTYNRASTLPRLFEALQRQTVKCFEWLIVDDGSTDGTEDLVYKFRSKADAFPVRYYFQEHGGKPRAQNKAVDLAEGELFITCDSNKYLADNAVELILKAEDSIKGIPMMCGVGGYRADFSGRIYGGRMELGSRKYVDCTVLENQKYKISGDKATAFYTSILREHKSPEYPGETFVCEGVWLIPMALEGYKTRWFPEILVYGEYSPDGLTMQGANSYIGHVNNFLGYLHYLKFEIMACGTEAVLPMIHEALDIAKEKEMPDAELASRIGCTLAQIRHIRNVRAFHKKYGKLSQSIKRVLGDNRVTTIKKMLGR